MIDFILQVGLVFGAMVATDFVWGRYIRAVSDGKRAAAANYSVAVMLLGGYVAISYVKDPWMLVPAAAGAFIGTFVSVRETR